MRKANGLPVMLGLSQLLMLGQLGTHQAPVPIVPASTELVRIDAVVVDHDGRPVPGLGIADFEVTEDGQAQKITSFEAIVVRQPANAQTAPEGYAAPNAGRHLLLFFDDVHLSALSTQVLSARLSPFLPSELAAGDVVTVVAPENGIWWTARTPSEYESLRDVVGRLRGRYVRNPTGDLISEYDAMRTVEQGFKDEAAKTDSRGGTVPLAGPPLPARQGRVEELEDRPARSLKTEEIYAVAQRRIRITLDALTKAIDGLSAFPGRTSVVFLSEGFLLSPALPHYDRVIDAARRARAALFFVDAQGLASGQRDAAAASHLGDSMSLTASDREKQVAGTLLLAFSTGGRELVTNDPADAVRDALREATVYYLLGYEPPPSQRTGMRRVKVRVRPAGLTVHARDRYFLSDQTPKQRPVDRALQGPYDETGIPLTVQTRSQSEAHSGTTPLTTFTVEATPADGSMRNCRFRLLVEARPRKGGPFYRIESQHRNAHCQSPVVLETRLRLPAGVWQARVVVEDRDVGAIGAVLHTFTVP